MSDEQSTSIGITVLLRVVRSHWKAEAMLNEENSIATKSKAMKIKCIR